MLSLLKNWNDLIQFNEFDFSRPFDFAMSLNTNYDVLEIPATNTIEHAVLPDTNHPGNFMLIACKSHQPEQFRKLISFDSGIPTSIFKTHIPTEMRIIKTSDNLELCCYIKKPSQNPQNPLPFVVFIHGGPRARDYFKYDAVSELLANRGIGTVSINFRGSVGFGKDFCLKGNGEWSQKMLDDIEVVVRTLQKEGVMHPTKVIGCGFSYGGTAVYGALAFKPGLFMAGIAGCADSDFEKAVEGMKQVDADYWSNLMAGNPYYIYQQSNIKSPITCEALRKRSPIHAVGNIKVPVLIISGELDQTVKYEQTTLIAEALEKNGCPVTEVKLKNEGHLIQAAENRQLCGFLLEYFSCTQFGLTVQPPDEELLPTTPFEVVRGLQHLKSLQENLQRAVDMKNAIQEMTAETCSLGGSNTDLVMGYLFNEFVAKQSSSSTLTPLFNALEKAKTNAGTSLDLSNK